MESQNVSVETPTSKSNDRHQDIYQSYIPGREGEYPQPQLIPKGFTDDAVGEVFALVLKPDGDFLQENFARIGPGTKKEDREARRICLLRYLLTLLPRARIIESAGTDASFHVVVPLTAECSATLKDDRGRLMQLLQRLRIIAFCDKVGDGLLSALSARAVGSINSKTGREVAETSSGGEPYSLDELESLVYGWFGNPVRTLVCAWFGVEPGSRTRCPFHDSADPDLMIGGEDSEHGAACCGKNHCAADSKLAVVSVVPTKKDAPFLSKLLLTEPYRGKWENHFRAAFSEIKNDRRKAHFAELAEASGRTSLTISFDTTDSEITAVIREAFTKAANIYCKPDGTLVSIDKDVTGKANVEHLFDDTSKLMALVSRVCVVSIETSRGTKVCPLPRERANVQMYTPDLRTGLKILHRVSKTPVLDIDGGRVLPPGYDAKTGIFYDGPEIAPRLDGNTPVLDKLLSGWTGLCDSNHRSCRDERAVAHLYATVFTEILADCGLYSIHRQPLFRGNQKGVGKDKLAEILGILRDGETPVDLEHEDDNRINQGFGNGLSDGRRIFQFTNIETNRPYVNTLLTRWSTAESLTGAKHGGGKWQISPNTATFVLTLNRGTIDPDLLDRLLVVDLDVAGDARKRKFDLNPVEYIHEHRLEIIAEVLGLAILSLRGDQWQIPEDTDRRFERWMRVIGTMLLRRGLPGFMTSLEEMEAELDEDADAFDELAGRVWRGHKDTWLQAKEILAVCKSGEPLFAKQTPSKKPERDLSRNVLRPRIGKYATVTDDTTINSQVVLEHRESKKLKTAEFRFALVSKSDGDAGDANSNPYPPSRFHNSLIINDVKWPCGDSGDNSIREYIDNNTDTNIKCIYKIEPTQNSPSIPPIPANTTVTANQVPEAGTEADPWGGLKI